MIKQIVVKSESEMLRLGKNVANLLSSGDFIALFGGLGAGKTTFVKGLADALGIRNVSSPTFNIVKRYDAKLKLDHFDCYRLDSYEDLMNIGFDDYLNDESVIVMEWSENVTEALPTERLEIHINGSGAQTRTVELVAETEHYIAIVNKLLW